MKPSFIFRVTLIAIIIAALAACTQPLAPAPEPANVHRMSVSAVEERGVVVEVMPEGGQLISRAERGVGAVEMITN